MSDGECHKCVRRDRWGSLYARFPSVLNPREARCPDCGAPKWLYDDSRTPKRIRVLCEAIAAFERGRRGVRLGLPRSAYGPP